MSGGSLTVNNLVSITEQSICIMERYSSDEKDDSESLDMIEMHGHVKPTIEWNHHREFRQ